MAIEYVDATQLDNALSYTADRIRAKTGSSSALDFDLANETGFGDDVDAIPTGITPTGTKQISITANGTTTEDVTNYANAEITVNVSGGGGDTLEITGFTVLTCAYETGMPTKWKLSSNYINAINLQQTGGSPHDNFVAVEEVEITGEALSAGMSVRGDFRANAVYALKKINFNNIPLSNIDGFGFVYGTNKNPYFESLLGLNFSKIGGGNYKMRTMTNLGALKNVTVKANTLGQLDLVGQTYNYWNISQSSLLTDASLVSMANGLCAAHTSKIQLHATPKARCSTLMGTVSQVTDDTGTYDFFTADANGTVSLADFITTTKGWTLA